MADMEPFSVSLTLLDGYRFEVDFGGTGTLITDEPEPLGTNTGPNPSRLLAAAAANCLAASLSFAIRKFKEDPGKVSATVEGHMARRNGRWRIDHLEVRLQLGQVSSDIPHLQRALSQFEDFCVVTQSVREGFPVTVQVFDGAGEAVSRTVSG